MKKLVLTAVTSLAMVWLAAPASAALVTFDLTGDRNQTGPVTITSGDLALTFSNIRGLNGGAVNYRTALGGLAFSDSPSIGSVDLTFSNAVRLVSYTVANAETDGNGAFFNLSSNGFSSLNNTVNALGDFAFTNTTSTLGAGNILNLVTGDVFEGRTSEFEAFAISSITVDTVTASVPEPATWAMMLVGFGGIGFAMRRRKSKITTTVAYA